jgi:glycosyltransferase involved in cell wall biosynthesis
MVKVSVVMSVYNEDEYIEESIISILDQTYDAFEFIIVDDGSTDTTLEKILNLEEKDDRIRTINNDSNEGIGFSLNKAIQNSSGEYIARMDSHNTAFPDRLKKQVNFLDNNQHIGVVGSWDIELFPREKNERIRKYPTGDGDIKRSLLYQPALTHSSIMVRKEIYDRVDGYKVPDYRSEDYHFYLNASKITNFANIPEPLVEVIRTDYPRGYTGINEILVKMKMRITAMIIIQDRNLAACFKSIYVVASLMGTLIIYLLSQIRISD